MSVFSKALRAGEGRKVRNLQAVVPLINALEDEYAAKSDEELAQLTVWFRERIEHGEELNDLLVEAFAAVREAAKRTIGQRHYDVQLMGGMALHFGWIAEMRTGEGKTLVSTAPAYLNALSGDGVHLVTVNDYLAKRDSEWMGRVYKALGITVGLVSSEENAPEQKRAAYAADITYGTNTELGFDYLRDNMAPNRDQMVQRGFNFAIVDEVDSILIDEARTPLIISGPSDESTRLYYQFASIARALTRDVDYEVDEEKRTAVPTEDGIAKVERQLGVENLYDAVAVNYVHQLGKALEAKELYHRDDEYIVADGEVKIVDEFTGRILDGRRWSDGLHQAVEAKERVRINEENHTWATVTLQNYFRMYEKLSGMTGTAETEAAEFASTYGLEVIPIPTHREMIRADEADLIFKTEEAKFNAVVEDIITRHDRGQPVLVGTASVEKSEHLSRLLDKQGIPHTVLNAKYHEHEASIVAQAGRLHGVTVATNMAGRGVDILLGGNPEGLAHDALLAEGLDPAAPESHDRYLALLERSTAQTKAEADEVRALGGLYVLGSERHESRRIDNQLRGRAGRQGDPGESRFYLSLEDELMRLFATGAMSWVMDRALPDDVPIEARMVTRAIEKAQNTVEQKNAEVRKDVLKYDEVMNEQRKVIYERRMQVIDGDDLREFTFEMLEGAIDRVIEDCCGSQYPEEWDVERLVPELQQYYPTKFSVADLRQASDTDHLFESVFAEAKEFYETREQTLGEELSRDLERHVMLQIIDQRWRQHLSEMDYLREGIHLRGIAQTDPLVAWQREGYEMFGKLMQSIDDDYLRFVTHLEVVPAEEAGPDLAQATYEAAEDPVVDNLGAPPASAPRARHEWRRAQPTGGACRPQSACGCGRSARRPEHQARPQRAVLVREREEVQGLPRQELITLPPSGAPGAGSDDGDHADYRAALADLQRRADSAATYLHLDDLRSELTRLEAEVADPDLWSDADRARSVTTAYGRTKADVDELEGLLGRVADAATLLELAEEGGPEALVEVEEDLIAAIAESTRLLDGLELRSLFSGEHDERDAIAEIHGGAGGTDAQDWAEMMLRMYLRWAERQGFEVELDEVSSGGEAGILSATLIVKGRHAYGLLSGERGVHRLVRMSPFDSQHRRQTSFASFDVTPFLDELEAVVDIDEKDLRIDTYRSSGAGGQHVNVTDSAVRITHLPTGIVVSCQNERSQHQNKAKAMQILAAKLAERQRAERRAELSELSGPQSDVAWGSQIRSYVMAPYQLVKDLRTNYETGNVEAVLDGDLNDFMSAYLRWRRAGETPG